MTYGMGRQLELEATDKLPFHLLQGFETGFVATVGTESVTVAAAVGRQMFLALKLSAGDACKKRSKITIQNRTYCSRIQVAFLDTSSLIVS